MIVRNPYMNIPPPTSLLVNSSVMLVIWINDQMGRNSENYSEIMKVLRWEESFTTFIKFNDNLKIRKHDSTVSNP